MKQYMQLFLAMTVGLLAGGLAGCGEDTLSGSSPGPDAAPPSAPRFLTAPAPLAVPLGSLSETKRVEASKDASFGVGFVKVKFPKNAILADTDVTITLTDQERMLFRIEPAGLVLLKPVELEIDHLDDRTDHRYMKKLRIVRIVDGLPQGIPTARDGGRGGAQVTSLGDFGVAEQDADGAPIRFVRYLSGPGYETKLIEASKGGKVEIDRFKVTIPKYALAEDTYITVRNPANGYLMCDLEPHGIVFAVPIELQMDLKGLDTAPFLDWTVFWLNDVSGLWENQGGVLDKDKLTVSLGHFSRYAAGRAGW